MNPNPRTIDQQDGPVLTTIWYKPDGEKLRLSLTLERPHDENKYLNLELTRETATRLRDALNEFLG